MATTTELLQEIVANAGGDVNSLPDNLETTLLKAIAQSVGGLYSDSTEGITTTYFVTQKTIGVDVTSQYDMQVNVGHIKIGKLHILTLKCGRKIYNTSTGDYEVVVNINVPGYFAYGFELHGTKGTGITNMNDTIYSLSTTAALIQQTYRQTNSTSQYSPDNIYQFNKVIMLIEN
ncbi:MAG: hypothetical protein IJZ23_06935 [Roseburia sp.]|nr:hypothetical protein [Roseburia sp.]MBQ8279560.1 hypothetical protein [Roseburia sp.]